LSQAGGVSYRAGYTERVGRISILVVLLAATSWAQDDKGLKKSRPAEQAKPEEQEPPEEDDSLKPKEYSFNPLEAERDLKVGNYYFKKGNYKAAASRFREATRWNPTYAEAFLRLGDSEEKLKNKPGAQEAYAKYLELAPDAKDAEGVKKKLAGKR
jgi:tetratricopeptide (TPR) repeat protein